MFGWLFGRKGESGGGVTETRELFSLTRPLAAPADKAFAVFVDKADTWWPRRNTWSQDDLDRIVIEPMFGGRCYERTKSGEERVWGKVLTISRPGHIVLTWQIRPDRSPEPEEAAASRIDVRFMANDQGGGSILLVHRDFPRHGEGWEKYKAEMAKAWPGMLDAYVKALAAS
ncbi:MAG TPA: SRPBCC domain-containing protein [Bauldia sp.]|nr:SRPBCC domain-containing protein [Bauldia sp.]